MSEDQSPPTPPDTIPIKDLDHFVKVMVAWHSEKAQLVQHLLTVPDGSEFQVGDESVITLTGETLSSFKLGIEMTMMHLGSLPFVVELEEAAQLDPEPVAG